MNMVDAKLFSGRREGYRYADMPDDGETFRGVGERRAPAWSPGFRWRLGGGKRRVVQAFADGELHGGAWDVLPCAHRWSVVMREALGAFYSHPWAWNEIDFGGPAYPARLRASRCRAARGVGGSAGV